MPGADHCGDQRRLHRRRRRHRRVLRLRIGTKTAKFGFPIARTLGNCLSAANIGRLSALIGATRLKEIIFTARLIEAEEAAGIALLHEVVEDLPALERRADELVLLIADQSVSNKFARAYWIIHRLRAALVARTDEVIE